MFCRLLYKTSNSVLTVACTAGQSQEQFKKTSIILTGRRRKLVTVVGRKRRNFMLIADPGAERRQAKHTNIYLYIYMDTEFSSR